jgi:hypothetical protein
VKLSVRINLPSCSLQQTLFHFVLEVPCGEKPVQDCIMQLIVYSGAETDKRNNKMESKDTQLSSSHSERP